MLSAIVAVTCGHPVAHRGEHIAVGHVVHCSRCNDNTCVTAVLCVHEVTAEDLSARRSPKVELTVIDADTLAAYEYDRARRFLITTRTDKLHLRLHYAGRDKSKPWWVQLGNERTRSWRFPQVALDDACFRWF